MAPLTAFPLPLPDQPPPGYGQEGSITSALSTVACKEAIDKRDTFLGKCLCIICGYSSYHALEHCRIVTDVEPGGGWRGLVRHGWIPSEDFPRHEPHNGLVMCANHRLEFEGYQFFIRFLPEVQKFVFVNYCSWRSDLQKFHGKAIALDIRDRHAPFPSAFILHEMRVRGHHPFQPLAPDVPDDPPYQDWILSEGVFDSKSGSFKRDGPPEEYKRLPAQLHFQPTTTSMDTASSGRQKLALNENVIADILAATRAMPSWKACQIEGTSWNGTAEENIEKYVSSIGVADENAGPLHDADKPREPREGGQESEGVDVDRWRKDMA